MEQERRRILVQGIVQGVGFRPFVYALATRWQLGGFVLNNSQGVVIEIEGSSERVHCFQVALQTDLPPSPISTPCNAARSPLNMRSLL
ncbi:hypothetical protein KDW_52310 [Dictyobacter vulcani]|uniref:acylphosphatase n=1 Tax=Dictyobacter vulcani TaxID=2607529 RepID=A0A5J4KY45_9CHLR|nr:acylphosphatase [Dictyobacter vulcani]GER91069.1 hypothetical protein KDW_52310 [Dictyobacter vulcani]